MTSGTDTAAVIALLREGCRPWVRYAAEIEAAGGAEDLLAAERGLFSAELVRAAESEISGWRERGIRVLTVLDSAYPERLQRVADRPPVLFVSGQITQEDRRAVAVIGTRDPSDDGRRVARAIAGQLVSEGCTVVSGLAAGIDTEAHEEALARGGRTIAVLGNGLDHVYPPGNARLQRAIADQGAVISQFWPESPPTRRTFPLRNGVTAGLSVATVIVEATETSGTRIQARLALGQGRTVMLLASLLRQPWAEELAGRPGVEVVGSPADVVAAVQSQLREEAELDAQAVASK